jgi:hypothetical protein
LGALAGREFAVDQVIHLQFPDQRHTLAYDSFDESLESFYFWLLDELTADG